MNADIIKQFKLLIKQIRLDLDNTHGKESIKHAFRLESIKKVLRIIENYKSEITSTGELKHIKGIGKGSIDRIDEILKTGRLSEIKIENFQADYLDSIQNLSEVFGIGNKKAHELVMKYNIKNIDDLKNLVKHNKVDLPENIIKGLKYVDKTKTAIPREEIDHVYVYLIEKALMFDIDLNVIICGSYRRLKPKSNDIDVLVYHNNIKTKDDATNSNVMTNFIKELLRDHFIIDNYTSYDVPTKFMGLCRHKNGLLRRIDIRLIPMESIHAAILYFTGSGDFNKKMRRVAMDLGYTLNEYGLLDKNGKYMKTSSEKDIFDILGMEYLVPNMRE